MKETKEMAGKTIDMHQIRQIIQNRMRGLSKRQISKRLGLSRNTLKVYLKRLDTSGLNMEELLALDDAELSQYCYINNDKAPPSDDRYAHLQSKLKEWERELHNPKVTRQLLWEEYKSDHSDGYGYSQFCHYLSEHMAHKKISAILHHAPGEKLMIDFAGSCLEYIDTGSGEVISCPVLVTVLPYSHLIYCEALYSQGQADFARGLGNALIYIEGVPQCILTDNMKSAVKRSNRYEPNFTELCGQFAAHYGTTFMATRVRKPKDKASVEGAVRIAYQRIYAKLRHLSFYSLAEINHAIMPVLEQLNKRSFKGKDYSRWDLFTTHEKTSLHPLPSQPLIVKKQVTAKVQKNYHVILGEDMHQYSVPYTYVGKQVRILYTTDRVEIYHELQRIATHDRIRSRHSYTTDEMHLAPNHRAVYESRGWDASYFKRQASQVGPHTRIVIDRMLQSKSFPEQTYNSCLGILRLANKYSAQRLEKASEILADMPKVNYTLVNNILKHGMDKQNQPELKDYKPPEHTNLRGSSAYE